MALLPTFKPMTPMTLNGTTSLAEFPRAVKGITHISSILAFMYRFDDEVMESQEQRKTMRTAERIMVGWV